MREKKEETFLSLFKSSKCKSIWVRILNRGIIDDTINRKINNL